ncbi:MAG: hypothetical protein ACF8LL_05120, partial [Phycisphaerales bacterium]
MIRWIRSRSGRTSSLSAVLLALVAGCGDSGGTDVGPVPTTIVIGNASIVITAVGSTAAIQFSVLDQNGESLPSAQPTFTSLDPLIASVDGSGVVTAASAGATAVDVVSGEASSRVQVTVDQAVAQIVLVSGDAQQGMAGEPLSQEVAVELEDSNGNPIPEEAVTFSAVSGGGQFSTSPVLSDAQGIARASWVLGGVLGAQQATAEAGGLSVDLVAQAGPGPPVQLMADVGFTTGLPGVALASPVAVQARDQFGNRVPGVPVSLAASDGGTPGVSPLTTTGGNAFTNWTLGGTLGPQTLTVSSSGLPPAELVATAVSPVPLTIGVPLTDQSAAPDVALYYTLELPAGTGPLRIRVSGPATYRQLLVRPGAAPQFS